MNWSCAWRGWLITFTLAELWKVSKFWTCKAIDGLNGLPRGVFFPFTDVMVYLEHILVNSTTFAKVTTLMLMGKVKMRYCGQLTYMLLDTQNLNKVVT